MSNLFISDRIFVSTEFCDGGILIDCNGKIENVFDTREKLDNWLKNNNTSAEVEV